MAASQHAYRQSGLRKDSWRRETGMFRARLPGMAETGRQSRETSASGCLHPALPPIAAEDVFVLGLRRSGIHAAVMWLIPHFSGLVRFVNEPDFVSTVFGSSPLEGRPTQFYHVADGRVLSLLSQSSMPYLAELGHRHALEACPQRFPVLLRPLVRSALRKVRRWSARSPAPLLLPFMLEGDSVPVDVNLLTVENLVPEDFARVFPVWHRTVYTRYLAHLGRAPSPRIKIVLVLREPWNQLASLLRQPQMGPPRPIAAEEMLSAWLAFAREFVGQTEHLAACGEVVPFSYPGWFSDEEIRRQISARLGREFTDSGLNVVADFGGGSSFDNRQFHGRAQNMAVRERWPAFAHHSLMRALCNDREVRRLAEQIFDSPPPDNAMLNAV